MSAPPEPPDADLQVAYNEFCCGFCFKPGQNLMQFLEENGVTRLRDWFHPTTPEPEAKAFIRLAIDSMHRGINFWEAPGGLQMLVEGRPPSRESQDALSVLCQIIEKPIKLFYHEEPGGPLMVMNFEP